MRNNARFPPNLVVFHHASAPTPARDTFRFPLQRTNSCTRNNSRSPQIQHIFINHASAPTLAQETLPVSAKSTSSRSSDAKRKISLRIGNVFFTRVTRDPAYNGYNEEFVMAWKQEVEFKKVPRTGAVGSPPISSLTIV